MWTSTGGLTPSSVHMRPPEPNPLPPRCGRHIWMAPYQYSTETASTIYFAQRCIDGFSGHFDVFNMPNSRAFVTVRAGTAYRYLFSKVKKRIICNVYY